MLAGLGDHVLVEIYGEVVINFHVLVVEGIQDLVGGSKHVFEAYPLSEVLLVLVLHNGSVCLD